MSEEQPIFVSSEDDLADVRERLAKITSRKVTLVIPSQTRLHSPVAWKLLHRDARQLGKDILIVSTDPQVRSVAQSVKFRVAHSLESSPSGRPTSGTRPSRTGQSVRGRGTAAAQGRGPHGQQRPSPTRRGSEQGQVAPRSQISSQESRSSQTSRTSQSPEWYDPLSEHPGLRREMESEGPGADEAITGGLSNPGNAASSTFEVFESPEPFYGQSYDYRIDTPPPILPLPNEPIEEPNLLLEDFNRAQDIRQAALGGEKLAAPPPTPPTPQGGRRQGGEAYRPAPLSRESDDPFVYMEDAQPSPSPEQRGAVSIEGFDTTEHTIRGDISDFPTDVLEGDIEYEGDLGDFVERANRPPVTRPWDEPELEEEPRVYGRRPRSSRSGHMSPPPEEGSRVVDSLPPGASRARPTPNQPPVAPPRPPQPLAMPNVAAPRSAPIASGTVGAGSRTSKQLGGSQTRPAPTRTAPGRPQQGRPTQAPTATGAGRPGTSRRPAPATRPKRRGGGIWILVVVLVAFILGALAYFGPSADVSITLPSSTYTQNLTLVATTSQSGGTGQTVVANVLSSNALVVSRSDFKASGSRQVGYKAASGQVTFSNKVTMPVILTIPTGTIVETAGTNPVQFTTTAEGVVPKASGGASPPISINAQQEGVAGNVNANAIMVIAPESLQNIAHINGITDVNSLKLAVTNPAQTTGGGTQTMPVVSAKDLQTAHDALLGMLQSSVAGWTPPLSKGDLAGKPYVGNVSPLVAPVADTDASGGTFTAKLTGNASALIVHSTALQDAAFNGLGALLGKDAKVTGKMLYRDASNPIKLTNVQTKSSSDNKTLTISLSAMGTIMQSLTVDQVQSLIGGKSAADARTLLSAQIRDIQNVVIVISPGFVNWISFWTGHINVHIKPAAPGPAKT